ncbi:MAG TPA: NrfD/PsrC family molybdoenzyme membrane anchor subunit, partial [Ktedonobacteraceae bacterium]|nr:NrfD/PsrC family molybdoenzyme membrane anchor subunit [Ktedonobacteraceae bacterium]
MDLKNSIRAERSPRDLNVLTPDRAGAMNGRGEDVLSGQKDYYNLPLVKKAHWKWEVVLYFFLGGASAGAYLAATVADLVGSKKDKQLIRYGRYISLVGMIASPILLIKDLGRPERFFHMLRILKFR